MSSRICIERTSSTHTIRHSKPGDRWDRDDTATSHDITGFSVVNDDGFADLTVSYDPVPDRDYFLLYVIYDTGDSFGRDEGRLILIDLYEQRAMAETAAKAIRAHYNTCRDGSDWNSRTRVLITYENGETKPIYAQWVGWFETLRAVWVLPLRMGSSRGTAF